MQKALSIKQPWAWLICAGYKDIENRDWLIPMSIKLPQRIYIHTGKSFDEINVNVFDWILNRLPASSLHGNLTQTDRSAMNIFMQFENKLFAFGSIIGEVDIIDCVTHSTSPWFVGKYGFVLANPTLYDKTIPYKGQLGFFNVNLTTATVPA